MILILITSSTPFFAYTNLDFDRGSIFPSSSSSEGIINIEKTETVKAGEQENLINIENPLNYSQIIKVKLYDSDWSFPDGSKTQTFTLNSGQNRDVLVNINSNAQNNKEVKYDVEAESLDGSYLFTQENKVRIINPVLKISGAVEGVGASGKFNFNLKNEGDINVTLTDVQILSTSSNRAVKVSKGNILTADGQQVVSSPIIIGGNYKQLNPELFLEKGGEISFQFDRFQISDDERGKPNVDMRGESITVVFKFKNQADQTIILQA